MQKYPRFYGGTVDLETGQVYDARKGPSGPRTPNEKLRAKAKASRKARKKTRRESR